MTAPVNNSAAALRSLQDQLRGKTAKRPASVGESRKRLLQQYEASKAEQLEEEFKRETIGLRTVDEYRQKRSRIVEAESLATAAEDNERWRPPKPKIKGTDLIRKEVLSFADFDEQDSEDSYEEKLVTKDPLALTTFLPDAERQSELMKRRDRLREEYEAETAREKEVMITLKFTIWNGDGQTHEICVKKDTSLLTVLTSLCARPEVSQALTTEIAGSGGHSGSAKIDNLLIVKDGAIVPNYFTIYELQRDQLKSYSGVMLVPNEAPEGEVSASPLNFFLVDKQWFDKNHHIYPLSTWEMVRQFKK
eukprot:Gregarina_sp_Poly_1__5720@NODE_3005_length_1458_cov_48_349389_g1902_i0_p1_GENE_NODE_3005_length_1458_cov_48_349389_g1902_i0NODE_3005_length_1458_cov_48_349389_g1902_i0_p1_ORF_typecomplete_len317_score46_53XAP5/PF04921_14/6_7e02XAP5/PF04921_14/1_8e28_NODE_3005_length_1458_cov_48_349389_g1902_i05061423